MNNELFLDTAYAIALSSRTDKYHEAATHLAEELQTNSRRLVTTRAVLLEIGNALSKFHYRQAAVRLLATLEADPNVEIIPLTEELYRRAFDLYRDRHDKSWGITDCLSFVVMQDRDMTEALTSDSHFRQAGFRVLLS